MYTIFLVEDEIVVRESIKRNVDWASYGFKLLGEAGDGELAFMRIKELKPDVLITDIKMPFMDGIELSRLLRQEFPKMKIVFLTGYSEFDYAKKAISLGASEYLLKPVTEKTLGKTLTRVYQALEDERIRESILTDYQKDIEALKEADNAKFFDLLIEGKTPVNEIIELARKNDMDIAASAYGIALMDIIYDSEHGREKESENEHQEKIREIVKNNTQTLCFKNGSFGYAFLLKGSDEAEVKNCSEKLTAELMQQMKAAGLFCFIALGKTVRRLGDIRSAYITANHTFSYRYILKEERILKYDEIESLLFQNQDYPDLNAIDAGSIDTGNIEKLLRTGKAHEAQDTIDEIFLRIGKTHLNSMILRQYLIMDISLICLAYLSEIGIDKQELSALQETPAQKHCAMSVSATKEYLLAILSGTLELRDKSSAQSRYGSMIQKAREYISENYSEERISLNLVAREVNVSPTHFSAVFKQETGQTFIEFLTELRMEKAKELLRNSAEKTSSIAYAVGYKDPHYFSYLFRKNNGCSPKEFRTK